MSALFKQKYSFSLKFKFNKRLKKLQDILVSILFLILLFKKKLS